MSATSASVVFSRRSSASTANGNAAARRVSVTRSLGTRASSGSAATGVDLSGKAAGAAPVLARQARALPLTKAPQVAADLLGIDLPAGQVHVRAVDQPVLVAGQRHPLG